MYEGMKVVCFGSLENVFGSLSTNSFPTSSFCGFDICPALEPTLSNEGKYDLFLREILLSSFLSRWETCRVRCLPTSEFSKYMEED
jgi:hypothetical protein